MAIVHFRNGDRARIGWARDGRVPIANGRRWRLRSISWITGISAFMVVTGCGPKSDRFELSGAVKLDGQPLDGASIRLTALSGEKSSAGAVIQNGEFHIPAEKGLRAGEYQVEINAPDNDSPPVISPGPGGGIPTARERVPPEYNLNSQHTIKVTPDGENRFDFDIVTGPSQ